MTCENVRHYWSLLPIITEYDNDSTNVLICFCLKQVGAYTECILAVRRQLLSSVPYNLV